MKQVTEERQQALIADCEEEIKALNLRIEYGPWFLKAKCESELIRQQIALASLTAEPIYQDLHFCFPEGEPEVAYWSEVDASSFNRTHETRRRILYPAPPVPVIKLPEFNLNHISRITAQISGQRYTYLSSEDVRHYLEEIGCPIVERDKGPSCSTLFTQTCVGQQEIKRLNGMEQS